MKRFTLLALATVSCLVLSGTTARAAIVRLGPGSFTPQATTITFSEVALGTVNPNYDNLMTTTLGLMDVHFGAKFVGQSFTGGSPESLTGTPTGPLTLQQFAAPHRTFTTNDGSNPSSPVLSGDPTFNGPISIWFSTDVAAVGLDGGFFDAANSTSITAYARDGSVIGTVTNNGTGIEFFGLADASGNNVIAGISFYITGNEPAGFAIDNVTFGAAGAVAALPVPPSAILLGLGGLGFAGRAWRKRRMA